MPTGAATIGTFLIYGAGTAVTYTAATVAVGLAAQTAIGLALYALSPKPKLGSGGGYLVTGNGAALDHQIIYGRTKVAGVRVFDTTTGGNEKFLHRIIAFTGHEIESFDEIYIGEHKVVTIDVDGNVSETDDPDKADRYDGYLQIFEELGSADQTVQTNLKNRLDDARLNDPDTPDWGNDHRLRGVSYLYVRFKYDQEVFPNGVPEITATIKGKKVYDPRTDTTAWSDNPALCIRDYLTNSSYGLGEDSLSIDDTSVAAAANVCEQSVTDANDSSVSDRYTCNGAFTTSQAPVDILEAMTSSMAGLLWYSQGNWRMKPGYWVAPTLTLDENDIVGPIRVNTRHSRRDNFNGVRGTYRGEASNWQTTDFPFVQDAGSLSADNNQESWADLNLAFTDTPQMAHRVARIALEQNRQQLVVQADFSLKAFQLQIGDVVNITNSRFGWSSKAFEVISWSFGVGEDLTIPVSMTLRETAESVYDQIADGATYELDNTLLGSAFATVTPESLTATVEKDVQADGTVLISADFSWSVQTPADVAHYEFEWKLQAASDYNSTTLNETAFSLSGLKNETTYDYRVRSVNHLGIKSPYATSSFSTGKDTTTPKAPTGVTVDGGYRLCKVTWTPPTQNTDNSTLLDLYQHKVYRGATSGFTPNDGTNLVGIVSGNYFADGSLDNNTTYHYKVKAVDYTGNESAASGSGSGTTDTDISSDTQDLIDQAGVQTVDTSTATGGYNGQFVIDSTDGNLYVWDAVLGDWVRAVEKVDLTGAVDVADFADGIAPPTIVTSLPASGDYQGQLVFLTTDNKLYRWTGTEWTTEIAAVDIVGEIDTSQIAEDAITAVQIADAAVEAGAIAAGAVTTLAFASGLTPVEISGTLPSTGNFEGRQVFLTTDNKLYRHTGSPLDASGWTVAVDGGDIIANTVTTGAIAAGAITADEIAANTISAAEIAANTITAAEIAAGTITAGEIAAGTITSGEIAASTITGDKIAANTIEASNIAANTITSSEIAANTITSSEIAANTITAGQIAAGAIGADEIAANAVTTEKLAVGDFSSKVTNYNFSNSGEGWDLDLNMNIPSADSGSGSNAIATMPTPQALRANVDASELVADYDMSTPVVPGEKYLLSFEYAGVGSSISRTWRVQVYFRDAEGNFLSVVTNDATVTTTTWTETTREVTVPSGAAEIYLVRVRALAGGSSNQILITNVRLRNISSGVLIEDGSITANKIVVGGLDAEDILVNGSITSPLIQAGTIEASKLKIDNVTLDTDGSGNLIVKGGGIDFTQLSDNSVTDVEIVGTSFTGAGPHKYEPTFTMDHPGNLMLVAVFKCLGAYGAGDNVTTSITVSGFTIDDYSITGSAPGTIVLTSAVEYSSGTFPLTFSNYDFNITSSGVISPSFDLRILAIKRYR